VARLVGILAIAGRLAQERRVPIRDDELLVNWASSRQDMFGDAQIRVTAAGKLARYVVAVQHDVPGAGNRGKHVWGAAQEGGVT